MIIIIIFDEINKTKKESKIMRYRIINKKFPLLHQQTISRNGKMILLKTGIF